MSDPPVSVAGAAGADEIDDAGAIAWDTFVSYRHTDRELAHALAVALAARQLVVFFDEKGIRLGSDWEDTIGAALRVTRSCIVLVGPTGVGGVQADEVRRALERQEADPDFPVIVVLLPGADTSGFFEPYVRERSHLPLAGEPTSEDVGRIADAVRGLGLEMPTGPPRPNPYPGLRPFDAATAGVFHGRERETAEVSERARRDGLVTVVGPSGTGKSSLLLAGVVPVLQAATPPAVVVTLRPGEWPRRAATDALTDDGVGDDGLAAVVRARAATVTATGARFVLVLDQLEEVVTRTRDAAERTWFLDGVADLAETPPPGVTVLAGVRSDRLGALNQHARAGAAVARSTYLLGPLDDTALHAAIERPAWSEHVGLQPGLADTIIADLRGQPNALPLLAVTMWAMWDRRRGDRLTVEAYQAVGRVTGALAQRAAAVLATTDDRTARLTVLRLVDVTGEGAAVRRRRRLDGLLPADATQAPAVRELLDRLVDARLVLADRDHDGESTYELAHDALLTGWPWLADAIVSTRRVLEQRSRLSAAVAEWERSGRVDDTVLRGAELREVTEAVGRGDIAPTAVERDLVAASERVARRTRRRARTFGAVAVVAVVAAVAALFAGLNLKSTAERLTGARANLREAGELNARATAEREQAVQARTEAEQAARDAAAQRDAAAAALTEAEDAQDAAEADRDAATGVRLLADRRAEAIRTIVGAARRRASTVTTQALAAAVTGAPQPLAMRSFAQANGAVVDPGGDGRAVLLVRPGAVDRCDAVAATCAVVAGTTPTGDQIATVAAASATGRLAVLTSGGAVLADDWRPTVAASAVALDATGDLLAVGTSGGEVRVLARGEPEGVVVRQGAVPVNLVAIGTRGPSGLPVVFAEAGTPGAVYLPGDGTEVPLGVALGTVSAALLTDSYLVVADGNTYDVVVWALEGLVPGAAPAARLAGHEATVRSLTVRGSTLVSGDDLGVVRRWDLGRRRPVGAVLPALVSGEPARQGVVAAALSADGERVTVVRRDSSVDVWPSRDAGLALTGAVRPGATAVVARGARTVVAAGGALLDEAGAPRPGVSVPAGAWLQVLADGTAVVGADRTVMAVPADGAALTRSLPAEVRTLAAAADRIAVGLADGSFAVIDAALRQLGEVPAPTGGGPEPFVSALAPDGTLLAYARRGEVSVHLVTLATGRDEVLAGHRGFVAALAFSSDGRTLASGADDRVVLLHDLAAGGEPRRLVGHADKVTGLAHVAGDDVWASTGEDGTLRLWTVDGVALGLPLRWGGEQLAQLSAGDHRLVALGREAVVTVRLDGWIDRLCAAVGPDPTGTPAASAACPA